MWVSFAIRHAFRKFAIGAAVVGGASLLTEAGRNVAKVAIATVTGAVKGAYEEIKAQKDSDPKDCT